MRGIIDRARRQGTGAGRYLAGSLPASGRWRRDFIRTYLERDIPQLGPRIPAETLRRFWTMLAHHQGGLHNAASLARGLAVDGKTIASYLDLFRPGGDPIAIEIKRNLAPRVSRGFHIGCEDIGAQHAFVLYPGEERYPLSETVQVIGLAELLEVLAADQ